LLGERDIHLVSRKGTAFGREVRDLFSKGGSQRGKNVLRPGKGTELEREKEKRKKKIPKRGKKHWENISG